MLPGLWWESAHASKNLEARQTHIRLMLSAADKFKRLLGVLNVDRP